MFPIKVNQLREVVEEILDAGRQFNFGLEVGSKPELYAGMALQDPPGGLIMIHGQPNRPSRPLAYYQKRDWTNGCIAVSNADMVDIWLMTPDNTPIQILP